MKKFFALLALAALLLTAFAFPVLAEEPILGGWSAYTDNPTEIPAEALDALNAAHAAGFDVVACWARRLSRAQITAFCVKRPSSYRTRSLAMRWCMFLTDLKASMSFCAFRKSSSPRLSKRWAAAQTRLRNTVSQTPSFASRLQFV